MSVIHFIGYEGDIMKKGYNRFRFTTVFSFLLLLLIGLNIRVVQGAEIVPKILFAGIDHSPIVAGDKANIYITSDYDKNVQYRVFLYSETNQKWQEITKGYSEAIEGKKVFSINSGKEFLSGKYKLVIHVKKAESKREYDNYYVTNINCISKDNKSIVNTNDNMSVYKSSYVVGEVININGINNIKELGRAYKYKLNVYDVVSNEWIKGSTNWQEIIKWTPKKKGTYILDLWVKSENSTSKYEGLKLKIITVGDDKSVAKVNNEPIMQSEVNNKAVYAYDIMKERFGEEYLENADAKTFIEGEQKEILKTIVNRKVMFQKGQELAIIPSSEEMKSEVNKLYNNLKLEYGKLSDEEKLIGKDFETYLQAIGYTEASCKEELEVSIVVDRIYDKVTKNLVIDVTDEILKKYYEENIYDFTEKPCTLEAAHILVSTEAEALEIKKQIDAGKDFGKLAEEKGTDGTKYDGGNLGVIGYADKSYDRDFMKAAIAIPEGQVSQPVKTQFGYHIIKIIKKNEYAAKKLDEVKEDIKNKLILEGKQKFYKNYEENWFKTVVVESY
jgi:foldase protein PrsA